MTTEQINTTLSHIQDIRENNGLYGRFGEVRVHVKDSYRYTIDDVEEAECMDDIKMLKFWTPELAYLFIPYDIIDFIELYVSKEHSDHYYNNLKDYDPSLLPPTE